MTRCRATGPSPRRMPEAVAARAAVTLLLTVALPGCAWVSSAEPAIDPNAPPVTMLYSPNGEPLNGGPLGKPTCREALTRWFDRLASSSDHVITNAAFLADARTQFRRMDIDGNGYLLPEELDRFRLPYRQPLPPSHHRHGDAGVGDGAETPPHSGRHRSSDGSDAGADAGRSPSAESQPDPVMSADTDLASKVTLDAFMTQSRATFARLDANHDGRLSQDEVLGLCEARK